MKITVGSRLQMLVMETLVSSPIPLRTAEIARQTGKSITAVKAALEISRAERVPGVTPTEWQLPDDMRENAKRTAPSKHNEIEISVGSVRMDKLLATWNAQRENLSASIMGLEITPKSDPKKVALQLGTLAGSIANLAYELHQVQSMPDWFEILTESN